MRQDAAHRIPCAAPLSVVAEDAGEDVAVPSFLVEPTEATDALRFFGDRTEIDRGIVDVFMDFHGTSFPYLRQLGVAGKGYASLSALSIL